VLLNEHNDGDDERWKHVQNTQPNLANVRAEDKTKELSETGHPCTQKQKSYKKTQLRKFHVDFTGPIRLARKI